ncbi:MAG: 2,3-diphosphoglycerate-dependent phosphoglycerate mutase, partial [Candidatus Omnitrophota bacterium]
DNDIVNVNIPTGIPLVYELTEKMVPVKSYYLASPEEVDNAMKKVSDQGKKG